MLDAAQTTDVQAETLLEVNNIEVIYNHVILVLKGVSLTVPKGGITALAGGQWRGQDDDAQGGVEPAAFRTRRGHERHDQVSRSEACMKATRPIWWKKASFR